MYKAMESVPLKVVTESDQRKELQKLYKAKLEIDAEFKELEAKREANKQRIEELMLIHDVTKVEIEDGAGLQLIQQSRSTISKDSLLREGVEPAKIAAATKVSLFNVIKCWNSNKKEDE